MKKLTKSMVCLAAVLVVAASTMGCVDKATGCGWFYDEESGNTCTFGFNVNCDMDKKTLKGQMQFKDHGTGQKVNIEEMNVMVVDCWPEHAFFGGSDKDGKQVFVHVVDAGELGSYGTGDYIEIWHEPDHPLESPPTWSGYLEGVISKHTHRC